MMRTIIEFTLQARWRRIPLLLLLLYSTSLPVGCSTRKGALIKQRNHLYREVAELEGLVNKSAHIASIDRQIHDIQQQILQEKAKIESDAKAILR